MARFRNDIFISYAHADNQSGWVDAFHKSLQNWLAVLGVNARIWRDRKLGGADAFSDEILDQLKQSALLISILSPNGIRSNWCDKERRKFEQYAESNGGFRIGNLVRALKVVMSPADEDAHQAIFGTIGYEFFERNSQTGRYDHYLPSEPRFDKQMDLLAQEIKDCLTLASALPPRAKPVVYVAAVTEDLDEDRRKIVQQLEDWGHRVAPSESDPLPIYASGIRAAIQSALRDAVISVHLFSDRRGAIPDEEEKSVLAIQYELANARRLDRIVWVLPNTQPHPSIAAEIDAGFPHGLSRLEGQKTIEDLKEILAAKLRTIDERPRRGPRGSTPLVIYVVCDSKDNPYSQDSEDRDRALALESFLNSRGYRVWFPPGGALADPHARDWDHRETLKISHAVILYWGAADEAWFRGTLRELTKVRARRHRPFVAEALYFTPPARQEKGQYRGHVDIVVEQFNGFEPDALGPFLDRLRQAGEATAP